MARSRWMSDGIVFEDMGGTIVLLTGSHLCHNPRVIKEATALAIAGYDVCILGAWFDPVLKARDQTLLPSLPFRFVPVIDSTVSARCRFGIRVRRKLGLIVHQYMKIENRWQLGYGYDALRQAAFDCEADLYIAHSEQAMAVGVELHRSGRRVGMDMEDWFSEDLLPDARRFRPTRLLQSLEVELLTKGSFAFCPSHAMGEALAREYRCRTPTVIYNAFPWCERKSLNGVLKDRSSRRISSIYWFSQTLGPGRGIEDLLAALPYVKHEVEVHLRCNSGADIEKWILDQVPECWRERIFLHRLVPIEDLLSRMTEHDIGFAGEMTFCRNRDLTVTNKILHYLLGGLAVVASNTTGQREVAEQAHGAVFLYPPGDAHSLAAVVNVLLASTEKLNHAKASALRAAEQIFCWEHQQKVLLKTVAHAIKRADHI